MSAHVLVVEDSRLQAEQLRHHLEAAGYRVSVATNGAAGYERLLDEPVDVVVTDIVMPEMNGYELCRAVKTHPTLGSIPVLLLTALADPLELLRALEAGADNFLRKPCDPAVLQTRIRDVLQSRAGTRPNGERLEAEINLVGRRVTVGFEKQQLLDLMFSSFEELVATNAALRSREENLRTAQVELESLLSVTERERRHLAAVLSAVPEAMLVIEEDGTVGHATAAAAALLGRDLSAVVGAPVLDVLPLCDVQGDDPTPVPPERHPVAQVLAGRPSAETGHSYSTWLPGPGGLRPVALRSAGVSGPSGSPATAVAVVHDLSGLGLRDRATGLAGPDLFSDRVREAVSHAAGERRPGVLLIGLDRFDALREALPDGGRAFLDTTARRLERTVTGAVTGALAAYLGRDEFGVLLPSTTPLGAESIARRLVEALREPVVIEGDKLASTASVGLAMLATGMGGVRLLHAAGTALNRARQRGGDCIELPDESLRNATLARLRLESELREASATGRLALSYRPHVRLATGEVVAVEVAVAWPHPSRGTMDLEDFLPLAEETGIVAAICAWALAEACRTVSRWRRLLPGAATLQLAMTVPGRWLQAAKFTEQVGTALSESGLPPEGLVLGLAEGATPDDSLARSAADELHRLGVEVAVVDFGRRSSLQSPRHLGAQRLLLEPSLVAAMSEDAGDAALIAGVVRLAHGLGLQTLASGVIDEDQVLSLRLMGCDLAEGPLLALPRKPEEFERWWRATRAGPKGERASTAGDRSGGEGRHLGALPATNSEATEDLRDEVLSYLAHELRNPLTVIVASVQLLDTDRDRIDPSLHDLLDSLGSGSAHLARIIDSIYDLRAAHLGTLRVERSPRDLAADLRLVLGEIPGLRERKLRIRIPPSCPLAFDGHRVRQVLVNVIGNAVKYTADGTAVEVDLSMREDVAYLAVRDHGPGIPETRRHELFRKFARLGNPVPGTGLGLFLSRAIARAHGGDLVYEKPDGPGARFVLFLPIR